MKTIQSIVNLIIVPLFALVFLTAGFGAAFLSALIEYSVIQNFFTSSYLNLLSGPTFALLLVAAFEICKLFLHFVRNKDFSNYGLNNSLKDNLSTVLIAFSFLCSLIFTVTTFYLPEYNSQEVKTQIEKIDEDLADAITDAEKTYNEEYNTLMEPYLNAMKLANDEYNKPLPSNYSSSKVRLHNELLLANVTRTTSDFNTASKNYLEAKEKKINSEIERLTTLAEQKKEALRNTTLPETAAKYDNSVLSSFLTVLSTLFFHTSGYTRISYFCCCILISLIISGVLEAIIFVSMSLLNVPMQLLLTISDNANAQLRATCHEIVITSFKSLCAFAIYLLLLSCKDVTLMKVDLFHSVLAIALSVFLTNYFLPTKNMETCKLGEQIYYKVRDALLQGVLSFTGFVFLGFLFGNDALTLSLNTIAIGLGATISGGLIQLPKLFLNKEVKVS